jgi:hypothetical protein
MPMPYSRFSHCFAVCLSFLFLQACNGTLRVENNIPKNALAVVPFVGENEPIPFPKLDWHKVLLPLKIGQAGILYLNATSGKAPISTAAGYTLTSTTELRGETIQHFKSKTGIGAWAYAQVNGFNFLSNHATLVEEAILDQKNGRQATWVGPFFSKQLQFNYPAMASFLGLTNDAITGVVDKVLVNTKSNQISGQIFFNRKIAASVQSAAVLSLIPKDASSFTPWWSIPSDWTKQPISQTPLLVQFGSTQDPQTACILPFEDTDIAQEVLNSIAARFGALPPTTYQTYIIQPVLDLGLRELGGHQAAMMVIDNCLVIGASTNLLERWVDALLVSNTLQQPLKMSSGYLWMRLNRDQSMGKALDVLDRELNLGLDFPLIFDFKGKLENHSWQFSLASPRSEKGKPMPLLWQTDLPVQSVAQIGTLNQWGEWYIESTDHQLILFDEKGKLRWSKKLEGKILGNLIEHSWLGQPENHLFFATANAIYGMESDAKALPGFPMPLNLPTTSGIVIGGRDHFMFYAGADGRLYGLDAEGKPLSGWNPGPRVGKVTQVLQFFQSDAADYLLVLTDDGELQALNRGGQAHFPKVKLDGSFQSRINWQWDRKSKRIVVTTGNGKAQVINALGESFQLPLTPGFEGKSLFCFADLVGDSRKDYLAAVKNHLFLMAYQDEYKLVFQKKFEAEIGDIATFGSGKKAQIVLSIPSKHQVWVLKSNGDPVSGFPVGGDKFAYLPSKNRLVTIVDNRAFGYAKER